MNSLVLLLICVAILIVGYICYGGWLCKQWGVGDSKTETPAHAMEDGVDYVPAKAPVLMAARNPLGSGWRYFLRRCP